MPKSKDPERYTIDIPDIRAYLATLAPTDAAGDTTWNSVCLVAQALNHKYGNALTFTVGYGSFVCAGEEYSTSQDVTAVVLMFDNLDPQLPTREQVEQAIPVLKPEGE